MAEKGLTDYSVTEEQLEERLSDFFDSDRDIGRISRYLKKHVADDLIDKIETLVNEYNDGRLIKSIEDNVLSTFLKKTDYVDFDYVAANPPYVDSQGKEKIINQTPDITGIFPKMTSGNWDLYYPFALVA